MRNEDILKEVDRRFVDQRELIEAKFTHLSAIVQSGFEMATHERNGIMCRQDKTNGRVTSLEDNYVNVVTPELNRFGKHTDSMNKLYKNKWWIIGGFAAVIFFCVLLSSWLIENVDARKTIEEKTGIHLVDFRNSQ